MSVNSSVLSKTSKTSQHVSAPAPTFTASTCTEDIRIFSLPGVSGLTKMSISCCSTSVPL
eukprot:CAMPEP_0202685138 /NCGR_PEP_ID=MMETSP1385-20130828/822_1 /ASSEMBLY_ACC=CAM_ASM_000861 /TAXON_ID=933848 /ORGANISM="Elphidium margaritaceum" /LENGTH=59 /DNA_ID=CAMNT_0049339405 /DNA_START=33 /DNA_END=209 /DNA_ORIENTATION=-